MLQCRICIPSSECLPGIRRTNVHGLVSFLSLGPLVRLATLATLRVERQLLICNSKAESWGVR